MFCSKTGDSSNLPPTRDALQQHICRTNYQAAIWCHALEAQPIVPSPNSHGWVVDGEGNLAIQWMIQPPALRDLLKMTSCKCCTPCSTRQCSCVRRNLPGTDVCGCSEGCENTLDNSKYAANDEANADDDVED